MRLDEIRARWRGHQSLGGEDVRYLLNRVAELEKALRLLHKAASVKRGAIMKGKMKQIIESALSEGGEE